VTRAAAEGESSFLDRVYTRSGQIPAGLTQGSEELEFAPGVCQITAPHGYTVLPAPGDVRFAQVGRTFYRVDAEKPRL
jgi:hypothetical protein